MNTSNTDLPAILCALAQSPEDSDAGQDGSFHGEGELPLTALTVDVQGHGPLSQPLTTTHVQALQRISTPAAYGQREQTLLDPQVRDTGEIDAARVTLHWKDETLSALQAEVACSLGLPGVRLVLHNLLIYGAGQFFKPHQDTEKHDGMLGTLVLSWPSAHIGGQLHIFHGPHRHEFASQHLQASRLRWVAFYADCRHEVLPVNEGWRVVLTFDLLLPEDNTTTPSAPCSPALLAALNEHFHAGDEAALAPWAFLLEHEYSEHGLRWSLIKGVDRPRVAALRAAARHLGLVPRLALAEIQEHWTATYDRQGRPSPNELIEDEMTLDFWVDDTGQTSHGGHVYVATEDAVSFSGISKHFLVDEKHEGYMGNYGDTITYWYRRAALVLQTPEGIQVDRFKTEFDAALADAVELARSGDSARLTAHVRAVITYLVQHSRYHPGQSRWRAYVELATALSDADLALTLCRHFDWLQFEPADTALLSRLEHAHGSAWLRTLLLDWFQTSRQPHVQATARQPWPCSLSAHAGAGRDAGLSPGMLQSLAELCLQSVEILDARPVNVSPAHRQTILIQRIQLARELIVSLPLLDASGTNLSTLLKHIRAYPALYPPMQLRTVLQALSPKDIAQPDARALWFEAINALQEALRQPLPDKDDYGMPDLDWSCRCPDCRKMIEWIEGSSPTQLVMPLAQAQRDHVEAQLRHVGAPVRAQTIKSGRPYKLTLEKSKDMHTKRLAHRQQWQDDLSCLLHLEGTAEALEPATMHATGSTSSEIGR